MAVRRFNADDALKAVDESSPTVRLIRSIPDAVRTIERVLFTGEGEVFALSTRVFNKLGRRAQRRVITLVDDVACQGHLFAMVVPPRPSERERWDAWTHETVV